MKNRSKFPLVLMAVLVMFILSACCTPIQQSGGVASVEDARGLSGSVAAEDIPQSVTMEKTDEQITTEFTSCLRDNGFTVADPQVRADGTVDLPALRTSLMSDPKFDPTKQASRQVLQSCLPMLEGATFAQAPSEEDQIELQDTLIEFAQCLRDDGFEVPDPDFSSGGRRAAMMSMLNDLNLQNWRVQESLTLCREIVLANAPTQRGGQR